MEGTDPEPGLRDLAALEREAHDAAQAWKVLERSGGLVGIPDIARQWGTRPQAVRNAINRRRGFPEPVHTAAGSDLWIAAEVEHWRATPRRRGRPPKAGSD